MQSAVVVHANAHLLHASVLYGPNEMYVYGGL